MKSGEKKEEWEIVQCHSFEVRSVGVTYLLSSEGSIWRAKEFRINVRAMSSFLRRNLTQPSIACETLNLPAPIASKVHSPSRGKISGCGAARPSRTLSVRYQVLPQRKQ